MNLTEMTRRQLIDEFSDAHKVFYGVRPTHERISYLLEYNTDFEIRMLVHNLHSMIANSPCDEVENYDESQ